MLDLKRRFVPVVLVSALGMVAGCAPPRPLPPPSVGETPVERGAGKATREQRQQIERAYEALRDGKAGSAEGRFRRLFERVPGLLAARTGLAYVRLRTGRYAEAARSFTEILAGEPNDLDALLGMGETAQKQGDLARAVEHYARASEARPDERTARKRLAESKLQFTEKSLSAARAARTSGNTEAAVAEYRQALAVVPEVAGLRIELADILASGGSANEAMQALAEDPTGDPQVAAQLGELQMKASQYDAAIAAYRKALEKDPRNADLSHRLSEAERAFEFSRMPEEYQRIFGAPFITRADLAALIAVKVTALSRMGAVEPQVAVDISGSWAKEHIIKTLAFDIIGVYANHTFQPAAMVRRGDLARAVARVLDVLKWRAGPAATITDMTPSHLYYDAAVRVVGAGLMEVTPEGAFHPSERISGREAALVIDALSHLVGP